MYNLHDKQKDIRCRIKEPCKSFSMVPQSILEEKLLDFNRSNISEVD